MSDRHARLIALAVIALATLNTAACATVELTPEEIRSVRISGLRARAEQGDLTAQVTLGDLYAEGDGVPQDEAEAVRWYRLAAEQGHAEGQLALGGMYFAGRGVPEDAADGVRWWRLAAELGHLPAQTGLGGRYFDGRGVEQDEAEAVRWYRMAAEQGDAEVLAWLLVTAEQGSMAAQATLAEMYSLGRGVARDETEAIGWYRQAAELGHVEAQLTLGSRYDTGRGVARDTNEAVRWYLQAAEQGAAEATAWVRRMAEQGRAEAQHGLGVMYAEGRGVTQDEAEAVRWHRLAAEQGHAEAQLALGVMYESGRGVTQDEAEAARWYRMAAEQGEAEAVMWVRRVAAQGSADDQVLLGSLYATGRGLVALDAVEAARWYRLAAEQRDEEARLVVQQMAERGNALAQVALASMYATGQGLPEDGGEALRWYRLAAEQGSVEAQIALGGMYAEGRGVAQDETEALRWYRLAAEQGGGMPADGRGITDDPFFMPIAAGQTAIEVGIMAFATIPNSDGQAARMMLLVDEPGTGRLFVNDMRGPLYSVSYNGSTVTQYLDLNADHWGVSVESSGFEQGFQSFAFHPQFHEPHTPGFGKFYTLTDTRDTRPPADFASGGNSNSHDTVLLEWTAEHPEAATYDGGSPRELVRLEQPFDIHNGGQLAFHPLASLGDAEFGLLYMGAGDGGGSDQLFLAQNRGSAFGKILRLDPLGSNSANGEYGIPADNPFANDGDPDTLGEIYALGMRNPQRFAWDSTTGNMFVADIGENVVEEVSLVTAGANLGWSDWEGSFAVRSGRRHVSLANPRGDPQMTYPVVEYGQLDPLLQPGSAVTGVYVYRAIAIPQLTNLVLFGDNPSGEVFAFSADNLPAGGQEAIRRILFNNGNGPKTVLQLIQEKNTADGQGVATRADLRLGLGPNDQVFVLNKRDGTIRLLVAVR